MPVDDMWYLRRVGPDGKRVRSRLHGKGKRWRCRYEDATGKTHTKYFERKTDAEDFEDKTRSGATVESRTDQDERRTTFYDYAERWRHSRRISQALEYQRHLDSRLRHHHYPFFGDRAIRSITVTEILEWLSGLLAKGVAQSSIRTYFDVLKRHLERGRCR